MQLWLLDVTRWVFLTDGTELKLISGIDDHSRFCVIAMVVRRATARAVGRAYIVAMRGESREASLSWVVRPFRRHSPEDAYLARADVTGPHESVTGPHESIPVTTAAC